MNEHEIIEIVKNEDNILKVEPIDDEMKKQIIEYEMKRLDEIVPFINKGLQEALDEQEAFVIIKQHETKSMGEMRDPNNYTDSSTFYTDSSTFTMRTESGKIIGEMIYDPEEIEELKDDPRAFFLSDNFVTYQDPTISGEKKFFVMEAETSDFITNKDLESMVESLKVAIPSTETDHYLRDYYNFSDDESLGTLIIGFTPK